MSTAVAEPPSTTLPNPPPSIFDDATMKGFEDALKADGNLSPTVTPLADPKPPEPKADPVPPPTPKPGEATPPKKDDEEVPEDIKSESSKSSWKKLKESKKLVETERDTIRTERDTLRAEFETLKKTATTPQAKANLAEDPEFIALKKSVEAKDKEAQELSERLRILDVEQHPKFKAYFEGKVGQQMEIAKTIGGDKLVEALKLPAGEYRKSQLTEIASELGPLELAQFGSVLTRLTEIDHEKQGEIAKAKESQTAMQAEREQTFAKQRAELENTFKSVTAEVTDAEKGLSFFREREGDAEWNKGVQERLALAQRAFKGEFSHEEAARAIYWAASAPAVLQQANALLTKNAELEAEILKLRGASPSAPGGGAEPTTTEKYVPGLEGMMRELEKVLPGAR